MDFNGLKTELAARGFDYLSDARRGLFINAARHELDMIELWPYRMFTTTGSPPVTITDLGSIDEVVDTSNSFFVLSPVDRGELRKSYYDLTTTGNPQYYFVDNGVLRVFPIGGTLSIRYFRRPPDLVGSTDTPLCPSQYHLLIVDMAARWAQKDSDDDVVIPTLTTEIDRQTALMRLDLLGGQQSNSPITIRSTGADL